MLVVLYFAARGSLLVAQYATPGDSSSRNSTSIRRTVFTSVMYGICAVLRLTEYLLLVKGFYTFLSVNSYFGKNEIWQILEHVWSKRDIFWLCVLLFLVPVLLLLSVAIPTVGIVMEVQYSQTTQNHNKWIFISYCVFNLGRYLFASYTRLAMAFAAIQVGRIWCITVFRSPAHDAEVEQPNQTEQILEDWKVSSNKFDELSQNYHQCGKKSQIICDIFKTWFIVPWLTYFIATSIKTTDVLTPWLKDEQQTVEKKLLPAIYYFMYNIFQLISLLVGYLCGLKMNTYHHVYYAAMRRAQLNAFNSNSRRAFARMIRTQKTEQYDFIPHVAYAHVKIPMDNPLYILFLLLGIFFTVGGALL